MNPFKLYKAGPVDRWLAEAITEFINGFIDGWGGGVGTGAGTGLITGTTEVGADMTALHQVVIAVAGVLAAMFGSAIQSVYVWHKTHRFPNPWPPASTPTNPPMPIPPATQ